MPTAAFRGLWAFSFTEFYVQLHEAASIATSLIVQVVLLIFVRILAPQLLGVALFGAILFSLFTLGQRVQNEAAFIRIDHKLNELYLASPLRPESYFLGLSIGILAAYLTPVLLLVAVTAGLIGLSWTTAAVLALVGAALWLITSSIGYVISTLFRDMRAIWPYASIFYNVFGVLPPVFYPIALLPSVYRPIALVMPPSAAAGLVQTSIAPGTLSGAEVVLAGLALLIETSLLFGFAVYWSRVTVREDA
ncbi:MAG TPA: ABC transporter permease [Thermoplasmata archaeon]|nr:ABC transporter permease [Thermoplasmata archaeon]